MLQFWAWSMYWLSSCLYFVEGVMANELYDLASLLGQSCTKHTGNWVQQPMGYINNPEATEGCQYYSYKVGDKFYRLLNWSFAHRWRDFGGLMGCVAFIIAFTVAIIRIYKVNKR